MRRMARLDTRELSSQEFQMAVLTALEEVTAQQQRTRRTLDRLLRRENREAVRHLLDQEEETENVESGQSGRQRGKLYTALLCVYQEFNLHYLENFKTIYFL